jgi:hypothetical protein
MGEDAERGCQHVKGVIAPDPGPAQPDDPDGKNFKAKFGLFFFVSHSLLACAL